MLHDPARFDLMFQALAAPARRQMVDRLSRGPASHWINERRLAWERRLDRLGDFQAESRRSPSPVP